MTTTTTVIIVIIIVIIIKGIAWNEGKNDIDNFTNMSRDLFHILWIDVAFTLSVVSGVELE